MEYKGNKVLIFPDYTPDVMQQRRGFSEVNDQCRLRAKWISQVFQETFNRKAWGVAILFRKNVPFRFDSMLAGYLMVSGHINSLPITMLNIYALNIDSPDFFCKVFDRFPLLAPMLLLQVVLLAIWIQF